MNIDLFYNFKQSFFVFVTAVITSYFFVFPINNFGFKYGLIDRIDSRKEKRKNIVRVGGLSIVAGCFLSFFIFLFISEKNIESQLFGLFLSSLVFYLIGLLDDIYSIKPVKRLVFQISYSIFLWKYINFLDFPFFSFFLEKNTNFIILTLSLIFSVIWISGVTNAINWLDGMDGLASSVSLVIFIGLFFIFSFLGLGQYAIYTVAIAGGCYGFLFHNYKPAFIIMGDGGAYFLGFNLATLSLIAANQLSLQKQFYSIHFFNFLPFILLAVPILDMFVVIIKRISNSQSPFQADRKHLHHKLLQIGFSYKKTLSIMIILNVIFLIFTFILISRYDYLLACLSLFLILNFIIQFSVKLNKNNT